jgi:hypothetical protein
MNAMRARLSESLEALREVFRNRNLRRLELAWAGSVTGTWAYAVALGVFAYHEGGPAAVGLVGLIRMLPAAVAAPFASILGDRKRRERVMFVSDILRTSALALMAVSALTGGAAEIAYVLAAFVMVIGTAFQPAQAALLPSLARTPAELTAANVASSTIESVGSFAGPALGGILLAATSPGVVFAATAGAFLWSALMVSRIRADHDPGEHVAEHHGIAREALAGFRAIGEDRNLRLLVGLFSAQTFVWGIVTVLIVVSSLDLLDLGESGVGFMNAVAGIGGLVGAIVALGLIGRRRLAGDFGLGLLLWGAPVALIGVWPEAALAYVFIGINGLGNTLVDIAGFTMLQRSVPNAVLARVFGVLESLFVGTIGIGAIVAPQLIDAMGIRATLIVTGVILPALALLSWRRLMAMDAAAVVPTAELDLLRGVPFLAPLPGPTLEHLAGSVGTVSLAAGADLFRQGDAGDRFYVVRSGAVDVVKDGRTIATTGPGGYVGEIALLKDVPRTATITARTDTELLSLDRDEFIGAVTGHAPSAAAADAVVIARVGALPRGRTL